MWSITQACLESNTATARIRALGLFVERTICVKMGKETIVYIAGNLIACYSNNRHRPNNDRISTIQGEMNSPWT